MKSHVKEAGGAFNCSPRQARQAHRLGRPSGRHMSNAISPSLPIHPSIKHSVQVCVSVPLTCLVSCWANYEVGQHVCCTASFLVVRVDAQSQRVILLHHHRCECVQILQREERLLRVAQIESVCPPRAGNKTRKREEEEEKMLLNQNGKSTAPEPLIMCNQMSERRREPRKTHKKCQKYFASLRLYACPAWEWVGMSSTSTHTPAPSFTLCGQCAQSWPQFEFDAFCLVAAFACPVLPLRCLTPSSTSLYPFAQLWEILGFNVYINFASSLLYFCSHFPRVVGYTHKVL